MSILHQLHLATKSGQSLAEAIERIIPGADPTFWRPRLATYQPEAKAEAPARRRSPRRSPSSSTSRRTNYAERVIGRSLLATVERARRAGRALVEKYGREHMAKIGRRGFEVTTDRHFDGDEEAHKRWLAAYGLWSNDEDYRRRGFGVFQYPGQHPATGEPF